MTILGTLRELVCNKMPWRADRGESAQYEEGKAKLNGEREKLRELCTKYESMKGELDSVKGDLGVLTTAIREAPDQTDVRCASCPLSKMQSGLKKKRRSRSRG